MIFIGFNYVTIIYNKYKAVQSSFIVLITLLSLKKLNDSFPNFTR
ncbi:conserved hypothetical protein [Carnobacterium maltaromaticum]|nr:conserved hypothetical protein [Carnobacterium maltaromaticum]